MVTHACKKHSGRNQPVHNMQGKAKRSLAQPAHMQILAPSSWHTPSFTPKTSKKASVIEEFGFFQDS